MKAAKLLHRLVSPPQAEGLRLSITNYRKVNKLLRAWEAETERLTDAAQPRSSRAPSPGLITNYRAADVRNAKTEATCAYDTLCPQERSA
jgi:hypothetical protein